MIPLIIFATTCITEASHSGFVDFLEHNTNISLHENSKIDCKPYRNTPKVRIDIGLSYNAPQSQQWLIEDPHLLVFGFEPCPDSIEELRRGSIKKNPIHGDPLNSEFVANGRFKLIPCALGKTRGFQDFFITENDQGCSSLFTPKDFPVKKVVKVPVYTLEDFFLCFPFEEIPYIEYMKIDAQGSDLDILKGGESFLEKIVYITIEAEDSQYTGTTNSLEGIRDFMNEHGFIQVYEQRTSDPTFLNMRFFGTGIPENIRCYQRG